MDKNQNKDNFQFEDDGEENQKPLEESQSQQPKPAEQQYSQQNSIQENRQDNPFIRENKDENEEDEDNTKTENKSSNRGLVGAILAGVLVLLALAIFGLNNIQNKIKDFQAKNSAKVEKKVQKEEKNPKTISETVKEKLNKKQNKTDFGNLDKNKYCLLAEARKYLMTDILALNDDVENLNKTISSKPSIGKAEANNFNNKLKELADKEVELRDIAIPHLEADDNIKNIVINNPLSCEIKNAPKYVYYWLEKIKDDIDYLESDLNNKIGIPVSTAQIQTNKNKSIIKNKSFFTSNKSYKNIKKYNNNKVKTQTRNFASDIINNRTKKETKEEKMAWCEANYDCPECICPKCTECKYENKNIIIEEDIEKDVVKEEKQQEPLIIEKKQEIKEIRTNKVSKRTLDRPEKLRIKRCYEEANNQNTETIEEADDSNVEYYCERGYYLGKDGYCYSVK